jgi:hypothetical protein
MMEEKNTATDLVFESSFFMAEDMLRTAGESVKEVLRNGRLLFGIASAMVRVKSNLRRHVLKHKWTTVDDRRKLRKKMDQIDAMAKTCRALAKIHERSLASIACTMAKMEDNDGLAEILDELDLDNFWEEPEEDEQQ